MCYAITFTLFLLINACHSYEEYKYQSYNGITKCTASQPPVEPKSIEEIQDIVRSALKNNTTVKAIGQLHSVTDCICTTGTLINMTHINHFSYNSETQLATVGAGSETVYFLQRLHESGRGVTGVPSFGLVSVGGAIALSVHGTGLSRETTLSDQIASVTLVDGRGNVRKIDSSIEDHYQAIRVNLGLLGVVFEVEFYTVEQYKIHVTNSPTPDDILLTGKITELATTNDIFQFWWFPTNKQVVLSIGNRVPVTTSGTCETHFISEGSQVSTSVLSVALEVMQATSDSIGYFLLQTVAMMGLYRAVPARTPIYTEDDGLTPCHDLPSAIGYSHLIMSNKCKECPWRNQGEFPFMVDDSNVAIPLSELPSALLTLRDIVHDCLAQFPLNGIYFRFLNSSDAFMAINNGMQMVSIEWVTPQRYDKYEQQKFGLAAFQAMGQALVQRHKGRPHWAKSGPYFGNAKIIRIAHPQVDKFISVMEELDPHEVFMNPFGRRVKFGSIETSVTPDLAKHCALNEVCLCQGNLDCGNDGLLDLTCGELMEFDVCKSRPNVLTDFSTGVVQNLLNSIANSVAQNEKLVSKSLSDHAILGHLYSNLNDISLKSNNSKDNLKVV